MILNKEAYGDIKLAYVYREYLTNVSVSATWGYLYTATQTFTISDAGDLTTKDIIVMFEGNSSSCMVSLDKVQANTVQITFVRATPSTVSGTIKIYVLNQ